MGYAKTLAVVGVLALAGSSPAMAQGDDEQRHRLPRWERQPPAEPWLDAPACGMTLDIDFPVDQTETRVVTDARGNTHTAWRGLVVARVRADDGREAVLDISGPGESIDFSNGDSYFSSRGGTIVIASSRSERASLRAAGLPAAFYFANEQASLTISARAAADPDQPPTETVVNAPDRRDVRSLCTLLRKPVNRQPAPLPSQDRSMLVHR